MWKANGKTTTLLPLQDSLYPTIRKREDTGNWKRKHWIVLCGELALEEAVDPS